MNLSQKRRDAVRKAGILDIITPDQWRRVVEQDFGLQIRLGMLDSFSRDVLLIAGGRTGMTLDALAEPFGIPRERVRQILKNHGEQSTTERRNQAKAEQAAAADAEKQRVKKFSLAHPEYTPAELAEACQVPEVSLPQLLGGRFLLHDREGRTSYGPKGSSDEALVVGLFVWANETGHRDIASYNKWAAANGLPSHQIVIRRFGTWAAGMKAAGLRPAQANRVRRVDRVPDEVLLAQLVAFLRDDLPTYSASAFGQYVRERGWTSELTVRNRFRTWLDAKRLAQDVLCHAAAPQGEWEFADRVLAVDLSRPHSQGWTREDFVAALREAASRHPEGALSMQVYNEDRTTGPRGDQIIKEFGGWAEALVAAGLSDRVSRIASRRAHQRQNRLAG